MSSAEKNIKSNKGRKVSVWNWLGTLILMSIPGVNLVSAILFIIFAKAQAKRSFAIAWLVLVIVSALLLCAAFLFLPEIMTSLAAALREAAGPVISLP